MADVRSKVRARELSTLRDWGLGATVIPGLLGFEVKSMGKSIGGDEEYSSEEFTW